MPLKVAVAFPFAVFTVKVAVKVPGSVGLKVTLKVQGKDTGFWRHVAPAK